EAAFRSPPVNRTVRTGQVYRSSISNRTDQVQEKAIVKSCRNTNSRSLNHLRFITNRTGCLVTDCHRFILIQTRCASFGAKPDLIMIR
ncbi:hypothetical protein LR021_00615, partial [Candidatus Bipolaricaulota bacterium]|nr:hypothetical protein [Candidatus Bipolaricaulota bacterium]